MSFLRYAHNFRAVAMVAVVAAHALLALTWTANPRTLDLLLDLIDNASVLWVFVAGFLFEHLSGRYRYRDYLRKKLLHVIVPYLLVSIPAIAYTVSVGEPYGSVPSWVLDLPVVPQALWMLLTGGGTFNYAVWFVPMIALFYLAAPLFDQFVRRPQLYIVVVLLVPVSMLAHRPPEWATPAIALYFLPAYLVGMWASHERARLEPWLRRWWPALAAAFGAAVLVRFLFSDHHGNAYVDALFSLEYGPLDWMFPQKLLLCFVLLGVLLRFDGPIGGRLHDLGGVSFTVFLTHGYLLFGFQVAWPRLFGADPQGSVTAWLALTAVTVALAAAGTLAAKHLLGRRSRLLIGS